MRACVRTPAGHGTGTDMAQKLSDRNVKALKASSGKYKITYDTEVPGFGIRVTKTGAKSFVLNYVTQGRERRYTIGTYPAWSVAAARGEAGELRKQVDRGGDPMADRNAKRNAPNVTELCERYLDEHARPKKRASSVAGDKDLIDRRIKPELGKLKVSAVTFSDIDRLHRKLSVNTPTQANRVLALLSKMFSLAIRWQLRADNPVRGVERNQERKRKRYLSGDEMQRLLKTLAEYPYVQKVRASREEAAETGQTWKTLHRKKPIRQREQACNVIRLLLLTGARKGEVLSAEWNQFDFDKNTWTKPGATTKQKTDHAVPLSAPALALFSKIEQTGPYVFPSRNDKPLGEIKHAWASIQKIADLPDVRLHDLRHTYASQLVSAGLSLPIIGALLGHTQTQTTARYAHLMDDPLREAAEQVGRAFSDSIVEKGTPIRQQSVEGGVFDA